jgi:hypothetical protein
MGVELSANSPSPVESVGLALLGDLIWAGKRGILRSSCAQIFPIAQILLGNRDAKNPFHVGAMERTSAGRSGKLRREFVHRRVPFSFPLSARVAASNITRWQSLGTRAANSSHASLDVRSRLSPTRQEMDGPSLIQLYRAVTIQNYVALSF